MRILTLAGRRLAASIPTLVLILIGVFVLLQFAPGDTVDALMAQMGAVATLWETDAAALDLAKAAVAAAGLSVSATSDRPGDDRFDAVLVAGACEVPPEELFPLLRDGGRLIVVEGLGRAARVKLYQKTSGGVSGRPVFDAAAPALAEFRKKPAFVF